MGEGRSRETNLSHNLLEFKNFKLLAAFRSLDNLKDPRDDSYIYYLIYPALTISVIFFYVMLLVAILIAFFFYKKYQALKEKYARIML